MKRLDQLIKSLTDAQVLCPTGVAPSDVMITGIAYDSRRVVQGNLFAPWPQGRQFGDGHRFIPHAIEQGAAAVVAQRDADMDLQVAAKVPLILVPDSRNALARLASEFYDYPSGRLRLIGVTGTNGKTTTTHIIRHLLQSNQNPVGLVGTIHNIIGERRLPADRTTPQAVEIQALLADMVAASCSTAVMEVSSIALVQDRVAGCEFDAGVFTNLSPEHLDDHGNLQNYALAKRRLFESLGKGIFARQPAKRGPKYAVINRDDPYADFMLRVVDVPLVTYGINRQADICADQIRVGPEGTTFKLLTTTGEWLVRMPLIGRFNVYNALAALAVAYQEGVPWDEAVSRLQTVQPIPGRFQLINGAGDFTVIVDYAHTPDSLQKVLQAAREFTRGRLIVLFGCGGDRDRSKRPQMGLVAAEGADVVIITSDNPRSENPETIMLEIEQGIKESAYSHRPRHLIVDREKAIYKAIALAEPGDTVLIAGKGHETTQVFHDRTVPFDDRLVAAQALKLAANGGPS